MIKSAVKTTGLTRRLQLKLFILSEVEVGGIPSVAVKCVDIRRNPVAKAANWALTDAEARKCGEQTGLDSLVVHTVNDDC